MPPFSKLGTVTPVDLALSLGCAYYRPPACFLDQVDVRVPWAIEARDAGLSLFMTIRANGYYNRPTIPPTDLTLYAKQLKTALQRYTPARVAIENEMNWTHYWAGTAEQYADMLAVAVGVCHEQGVLVSDGGLVSGAIAGIVADYLYGLAAAEAIDPARALEFAATAFSDREIDNLTDLYKVVVRASADTVANRTLLELAVNAGIDALNFHWYIRDDDAIREAARYLKRTFGLSLVCNEAGQFSDDPDDTSLIMRSLRKQGVDPVIWYSIDSPPFGRALQNPDGSLRATGKRFKVITSALARAARRRGG